MCTAVKSPVHANRRNMPPLGSSPAVYTNGPGAEGMTPQQRGTYLLRDTVTRIILLPSPARTLLTYAITGSPILPHH